MTIEEKPASPLLRIISVLRTGPLALILRFYDQWRRAITGIPVWHLSEITPQLYIGGQQRKKGWTRVQSFGITAIVNMRESWHSDVEKGVAGERHLHMHTIDNTPPKIDDLYKGVAFIQEAIEAGGKVYVHCGIGVGRAPTMAGAYLISTGMTRDEAMETMRRVRPFVHPTRRQLERLAEFEIDFRQRNGST